ncbi:MAG: DUF5916 domain-containing protein [Vicinamibacterales bacterium]
MRSEGEQQSTGAPALGRTSNTSGGGLNVNWDGAWDVKTRITAEGWTAEFYIPLRTLRYGPPPQLWGLNFARSIERKREQVYWSPITRVYNITRLSSAGDLRDLNVAAPRNFKVMPYALASANRNFTPGAKTDGDANWGVDAKIGVTSSLNLDLTYNTDFAQVEVDEQQVNLTRFNLLFPEKRPFFLENRGLFAVGKNGEIDLFFSRRIGITDNGTLVPIRGGARLSGKVGGLNVGVLDMQTDDVGSVAANNFGAVRVAKDLPNRSSVGGIFVNRAATGDLAGKDDWNRTWGVDGKWGIAETWTWTGFAARTETPGAVERERAFSSSIQYQTLCAPHVLRVHGGRRGLQPRGRLPRASRRRVPAVLDRLVRERQDVVAAEARPARMASALQLRKLLGVRRLPGDRDLPRRQRVGLRERQQRQPGDEHPVGRVARTVRGLQRGRRPGRQLSQSVCRRALQHRSAQVDLALRLVQHRRVPVRHAEQLGAAVERSQGGRLHVEPSVDHQRHPSAAGRFPDERRELPRRLQLLDDGECAGVDSVQRHHASLVHEPALQLAA